MEFFSLLVEKKYGRDFFTLSNKLPVSLIRTLEYIENPNFPYKPTFESVPHAKSDFSITYSNGLASLVDSLSRENLVLHCIIISYFSEIRRQQ